MASRSAEASIKGYFYQFDSAIMELLQLSNSSDSITIEGIEDVDITTATDKTAIQFKYYEGTEYNHSVIAEPIRLMLTHFSELKKTGSTSIKYILRGHFKSGHHKLTLPLDLAFIKTNLLTYKVKNIKHEHFTNLSLSDADLIEFINLVKIDINAKSFTEQYAELLSLLKLQFSCGDFSAEHFYYNNCLKQIRNLSIQASINNRKITKEDFITSVNTQKVLFNEWFIFLKSKKQYITQINSNLKAIKALEQSKSKIILIGNNILTADNSEMPFIHFVENIVNKFYKMNSSLRDAKPLTFILDCHDAEIKKIKALLINDNWVFNDGYEHINFSPAIFNADPVKNISPNLTKIIKSSYFFRILSRSTFENSFDKMLTPKIFLNFSNTDIVKKNQDSQFFDLKYCENLNDIHQVLTK
jgi:hypothetical protein